MTADECHLCVLGVTLQKDIQITETTHAKSINTSAY